MHTIRVTFPFDSSVLRSDYMQNASAFAVIDSLAAQGAFEGASVEVISFSSPEGNYQYNLALSGRRAGALRKYLVAKYPVLEGNVTVNPDSESWSDLRKAVAGDTRLTDESRTKILGIIDSSAAPDAKEASLKALPEYKSLYRSFFRAIRYAEIVVRIAD
ncbi:MAG: OmpA family protein, partial [Bacteroidales bacterium]|nr:OmpA family protein [Bacteroidales bacterium]